jgi:P pilus assembly chaperone PapD
MSSKKKNDTPEAASTVDPDVVMVEAAFAAGNNSAVRALATSSTSPPARELAQRLMAKVVVEKEQVLAGVVGLIVVSIAAALTLVRG